MITDIIEATPEHAYFIAEHAREDDVNELYAAARHTPLETMRIGMRHGSALVGTADGVPVCMWGVSAPLIGKAGSPWMVGTTELDKHAMAFLRRCRPQVVAMLADYDILQNYVDVRNRKAIIWLKWLGFSMDEAAPFGPFKLPFHRFEMRRE